MNNQKSKKSYLSNFNQVRVAVKSGINIIERVAKSGDIQRGTKKFRDFVEKFDSKLIPDEYQDEFKNFKSAVSKGTEFIDKTTENVANLF